MISINAYNEELGHAPQGIPSGPQKTAWLLGQSGLDLAKIQTLAPPEEADLNKWEDPRVGWGVVVVAKKGFTASDYASGKDLENDEVLRKLLDHRRAVQGSVPVFHYNPDVAGGPQTILLRNYAAGKDLDLVSKVGLGPDKLPYYLLIYAAPSAVPWTFQATLQVRHAVGRLDPAMPGLVNYVDHLVQGWKPDLARAGRTVVWTVDHGDITSLMREALAVKLHQLYAGDSDLAAGAAMLDAKMDPLQATSEALIAELTARPPGLVVTCSHGKTGPLGDKALLAASLGIPVDQFFQTMDLDKLLRNWQPAGAVWFAQACCSVGSDSPSRYQDLYPIDTEIGSVLSAVAATGAHIAPLPQRLLGCENPARGFFGHIEPTFNITLQSPLTKQVVAHSAVDAFYNRYFGHYTLGRVLNEYHRTASTKYAQWCTLINRFNRGDDVDDELLYTRTTAIDIDALVLIGDPTAAMTSG